ncbi:hypothetical protein HKD37_12G033681 [Glycine soja]
MAKGWFKVYMEDEYVRKMSNEVDIKVDMDNDIRINENIYKHYGQETGKIVDCSEAFITTKFEVRYIKRATWMQDTCCVGL